MITALLFAMGSAWADPTFDVRLETTEGPVVIRVHRDWAPEGAERVHALVQAGYYDGVTFHRVLKGFMAQFGIASDPKAPVWPPLPDDPVTQSNTRGRVTFATSGPNRRTTQLFINTGDNASLDAQGFSPVGEVVEGMEAIDTLHHRYGDGPPRGKGPSQTRAKAEGDAYLARFPKLDRITRATVAD